MDRFTALKTFCAVVEEGSFAAAARAIGLSSSAVSKNIAELEAELGVRLISRTTRRLSVTDGGMAYYRRVSALLADLESADEFARDMSATLRGRLRVTAPMSFGNLQIAPIVSRFIASQPDIVLEVDYEDQKVDVLKDGFDLAIRGHGRLEDSSLIARKLAELDHVVCAAPVYLERRGIPAHPAELREHSCLCYTQTQRKNQWVFARGDEHESVAVSGPYLANNSLALRQAALDGTGIVLMPWLYVREELQSGRLEQILPDWLVKSLSIYAIYPSGANIPKRLRVFIDFLADELRSHGPAAKDEAS